MKTTKIWSGLVMAGVMTGMTLAALGQDEERRRGPRPEGGPQRGGERGGPRPGGGERGGEGGPLMRALDRNGDGSLDQFEIDMAVVVLRRMDRNEDGKVTGEELAATPGREGQGPGRPGPGGAPQARPGGGRGPGPDMFSRIDSDGDGKISKDEAPDRMAERFDEIDTNGDGFIDKEEQEKLIQMLRQRFQQGNQRPGGRPDPGAGEGGTDRPRRPRSE